MATINLTQQCQSTQVYRGREKIEKTLQYVTDGCYQPQLAPKLF